MTAEEKKELLEEAIRRFPIGTEFDNSNLYDYCTGSRKSGSLLIWSEGKWAMIIKSPCKPLSEPEIKELDNLIDNL